MKHSKNQKKKSLYRDKTMTSIQGKTVSHTGKIDKGGFVKSARWENEFKLHEKRVKAPDIFVTSNEET